MHIQESFICGKHTAADCEDGMVITPHFAAVIDGSTSKTPMRLNPTMKNGRFAMLIISDYIQQMPACATIDDFCQGVTMRIANEYAQLGITAQMTAHPEERLTASAIIYSHQRQEVWMVGETGYYLVAEIVNILVDEKYLAEDGNPDLEKMELIVFDPIHHGYIQLGEKVGNAFSDGKALYFRHIIWCLS